MKNQEFEMQKILIKEFQDDVNQKLKRYKELQVQSQQEKRKENYNYCQGLAEQLFQLSDLMYNHQQNIDNREIQQDYFDEQAQLFIQNQNLISQKKTRHFNTIQQLKKIEELDQEQKQILDSNEMQLYLNGKGRWTPEFKVEFEEPQKPLEENDKFISNKPINNYYLGNMIRNIIEQYYDINKDQLDQKEEKNNDKINKYLAFKGCIIGYQFSGKDTIAQYLSQKYEFAILSVEQSINELLKPILSKQSQPQLHHQKTQVSNQSVKSNRSGLNSQRLTQRDQQSQQNVLELTKEQQEYGQYIFDKLSKGEQLQDENYIQVIKLKLLQLFPNQDQEEFLQYLKQLQPNQETIPSYQQVDEIQLKQNRFKYSKGFIIIDFPNNYQQAKLLDKELGDFVCKDEQTLSWKEEQLGQLKQIIQYTPDIEIERNPINALFDQLFFIDISCKESLRRAVGRRIDNEHHTMYHLEDNVPSLDQAPLNERIVKIRDIQSNEMVIVDKNNNYDNMIVDVKDWYEQQGQKVEKLIQIDNQQEEPQQQIVNVQIDLEPEILQEQEREYTGEQQQQQVPETLEEQFQEEIEGQQEQVEEQQLQEEQPQQEQPKDQQTQNTDPQYIKTLQIVDGHQKINEIFQQIDKNVQQVLENKENQFLNLENQIKLDEIQQQKQIEEEKIQAENDKKWLLNEKISEQVSVFLQNQVKDKEIIESMYKFWQSNQTQYIQNNKVFFDFLREQRELIQVYFKGVQTKFIELLQTKDSKFYLMRQYQDSYNKFVDEQPDMVEEEDTKNELNQVVEDLHNNLFDLICKRQEFCQEEISQQKKYNWIEQQLEQLTINLIMQIQNEFIKTQKNVQLIRDFYQLQQPETIPEQIFESILQQCQDTQIETQENKDFQFPRLEKAIQLVLKLFEGDFETDDKKKAPPGKKPAGKAPVKPGQKQQEEEVKEATPFEKEGTVALNTENAIFRYNINIIKQYGLQRLKEYRTLANILFNKLETWLEYYVKVQNDAVSEMANIFRDAIENQQKLQNEITLDETEVIVSSKWLNFFTPPPVILPAREDIYDYRFSISQLYQIIEEIKCLTDDNGNLDLKCFLLMMNRKVTSSLNKVQLPVCWRDYTINHFQIMCNNLNPYKTGQIQSRDLCIYLILLNSEIMNQQQEQAYKSQLFKQDDVVNMEKNQFIEADCWFDKDQDNKIEENTNFFGRTKYIKELIFYVFKDEDNTININEYFETLRAQKYTRKQNITYNQMLFEEK